MKKFLIGSISAFLPLMAFAQTQTVPTVITDYTGVVGIINKVGTWMFGLLLALAVVFLLYAAFTYLRAGGDPSKVDEAKNVIIYALIAIVVAVLAKGLIIVVGNIIAPSVNLQPGA